ncbi:14095_t:CDS:2 [Rhizophagus irregularis]|nr:14095_t:CDS:2 [Rhizophagus irregularis]
MFIEKNGRSLKWQKCKIEYTSRYQIQYHSIRNNKKGVYNNNNEPTHQTSEIREFREEIISTNTCPITQCENVLSKPVHDRFKAPSITIAGLPMSNTSIQLLLDTIIKATSILYWFIIVIQSYRLIALVDHKVNQQHK